MDFQRNTWMTSCGQTYNPCSAAETQRQILEANRIGSAFDWGQYLLGILDVAVVAGIAAEVWFSGGLAGGFAGAQLAAYGSARLASRVATSPVVTRAVPNVGSDKLQNLLNNLYKGTTNPGRVGDGTTMSAIRNELKTGQPTAGRYHSTKGQETVNGLRNWLRRNPDASTSDRMIAESHMNELLDAMSGK